MPDAAVHRSADAASGDGGKVLCRRNLQTFLSGFFHHGLRQRMFAAGLRGCGQGKKALFSQSGRPAESHPLRKDDRK